MAPLTRDNKSLNAKHAAILKDLLKLPDNKICGDCKRNDARWASTNIGVFVCIRCSGIHRGMGVHISRVKSVDLDTWTPEQIANIQRWGNKRANLYWEAHLRAGHQPPEHKMESFIRSKYESKRWAMDGPIPDPDTLDAGPSSAPVVEKDDAPPQRSASLAKSAPKAASGIDLLGESSPSVAAPPVVSATKDAPKASGGNGLLDLDFSASSSSAAAASSAPRNNKADILSLFGQAPPQPAQPITQPVAPSPSNSLAGTFAGMSLGGASSASNPWSSPPTGAAQSQPSLFNSQDVWGGSSAGQSSLFDNNGFSDFGGAPTAQQSKPAQNDAFGSIWN